LYYLVRGAGANTGAVYRVQYPANPVQDVSSDNAQFVASVYHDLLGRPVDATGRATFLGILDAGRFEVFSRVGADFATSVERRAAQSAGYYTTFRGRSAAPAEVNAWLQTLAQGNVLEQALDNIAGSGESFQRQGGSNSRWLDAMYQALLGRALDPGAQ